MMQFELYIFYTVKVVELALRENLSNHEILDEMLKYHAFEKVTFRDQRSEAATATQFPLHTFSLSRRADVVRRGRVRAHPTGQ